METGKIQHFENGIRTQSILFHHKNTNYWPGMRTAAFLVFPGLCAQRSFSESCRLWNRMLSCKRGLRFVTFNSNQKPSLLSAHRYVDWEEGEVSESKNHLKCSWGKKAEDKIQYKWDQRGGGHFFKRYRTKMPPHSEQQWTFRPFKLDLNGCGFTTLLLVTVYFTCIGFGCSVLTSGTPRVVCGNITHPSTHTVVSTFHFGWAIPLNSAFTPWCTLFHKYPQVCHPPSSLFVHLSFFSHCLYSVPPPPNSSIVFFFLLPDTSNRVCAPRF